MEQSCPRCKSSKYRNPNLVMMVNVCGHVLCEPCVEQLFVRGSGACPQCQKPLKRSGFRVQFFEDAEMDKEIHIRKKVEKDMLLRQEDFPSLLEFNDYLEAMETIVFNLVNGVDLEGTKKKMEGMKDRFKKELQKAKGARFKSKDQEFLAQVLEEERSSMDDGARRAFDAQRKEEEDRAKEKDRFLDDLQDSEMSAEAVMAIRKRKLGIPDQPESDPVIPVMVRPVIEEPPPLLSAVETDWFRSVDQDLLNVEDHINGPKVPSPSSLNEGGYLSNIRASSTVETAMGFPSVIPARRALLAAADGLYSFHRV